MADQYMSMDALTSFFWTLTCGFLNIDTTTDQSSVRQNWPEFGAPSQKITDDICYIAISPTDNPQNKQFYNEYTPYDSTTATSSLTYIDAFRVNWLAYGPSSSDNIDLIRASLNIPSTTDSLTGSNLALVTDINAPIRNPELFNGQWWPRSSFYADFTQLAKRESTTPYLQTADIILEEG